MKLNLMAIRIFIWFGLLSISTWWGSRSVMRYWNQPLTTNMVYSFGDNENGIQFPLMTFCDDEFVSKKITIECKDKSDWPYFIETVTNCLKNNKTFKLSNFINSLQMEKSDIINTTRFFDGFNRIELQHLEDKIWSKVFHPVYGPCHTFDLSNVKEFEYIPYGGFARPVVVFLLSNEILVENLRILLHTKYDLPDAFQLNGKIPIKISNQTRKRSSIIIRKKVSRRETTRKSPCNKYEYITCQNIENNKLVLNEYDCQIPALYYGKHLDNFINTNTSICSDEVAKKAIHLTTNESSNCTRSLTCEMTRFTFVVNELATQVENTNMVQLKFSNPEVANYHTYICYDLPSLIGEVGGILGLTLGVSVLAFFESFLHRIPSY